MNSNWTGCPLANRMSVLGESACQPEPELFEICDQAKDLERQMQHAQRLQSLGQNASSIAHDFKSLLTGILGNACLASERVPQASAARQCLEEIESLSYRAADLVNQILIFAKNRGPKRELVSLRNTLEEMTQLLKTTAPGRVPIHFEFGCDHAHLHADSVQLRQVILNLVHNAACASVQRDHPVVVRTKVMQLNPEPETGICCCDRSRGDYCVLEVEDKGRGMDWETKNRVFEPYFTTREEGTGLGMSTIYGIVRRHQGFIRLKSEVGVGTRCSVYFPLHSKPGCDCHSIYHIE